MLARKDHAFEAGIFKCCDPLIGIKFCRIKNLRLLISLAPLFIRKRVGSEMHESIEFHFVPRHLAC